MNLQQGNIWDVYEDTDALVITTNAIVYRNGLVMGAGAALQAKERFPFLPRVLGKMITEPQVIRVDGLPKYGFVFDQKSKIGALQTKYHYYNLSPLSLVKYSLDIFSEWLKVMKPKRVDMVFPAIGLGGQSRKNMMPLLEGLQENVYIWTLDHFTGIDKIV